MKTGLSGNRTGGSRRTLIVVGLLAAAAGCRPSPPAAKPPAEENAIQKTLERGPVKVVLRVEPKEPTFAERVRFTIDATARNGVEVTLPSPGENLGEFIIKDYDAPPERTTADATEHHRSYVLEFLTSGEYRIPPMTISFRDRRQSAEAAAPDGKGPEKEPEKDAEKAAGNEPEKKAPQENEPEEKRPEKKGPEEGEKEFKIVTEEIKVQVKPLADTASLKELAPIAGPAEPPPLAARIGWPLGIAGGLAALGLALYLGYRFLRRPARAVPPVGPHQRAYGELEWLLAQGFVERGEMKEFFFHLSRILREYIENRFGLRAPERTTEEFLLDLAAPSPSREPGEAGEPAAAIPLEHQRLLREFLERADLVKFARYAPAQAEVESSFEAAKRFIEETMSGVPRQPATAAHPPPPSKPGQRRRPGRQPDRPQEALR